MMDLQHGLRFVEETSIRASTDYAFSANSNLCIVTAGERQKEGQSRRDLLLRNFEIFKDIIPKLVKHSPNTVLLVVSNPVEVLTYVAWKISGLPADRVIGSGTNLDTARLHFFIGEKLNIPPNSVHGWIIGEHGDSSVPVWSGVNIDGVMLKDLNPQIGTGADRENWNEIHKKVIMSAYEVIKLKGYTSWAVGLSVANISKALLGNMATVQAVSTIAKGFYGIKEEVFLSLPCVLGPHGVKSVVSQQLDENEVNQIQGCARIMQELQQSLVF
ncbi:L-lactate dehydrogenase-like isoform X2 [Porites lutea]